MAALEERAALTGEASHLFRIRRTLLKMLKKRAYVVDAAQLAMTPRGFVDQFGDQPKRNDLTILAEHETDAEDQLFVFLPDDDKVGVKTIKQYCEMMKEASVSHAILVVKQGVTPFAKTALQEMASTYLIEHFRDAELLVDVTEHRLVPAHALLSPEDRQALLDRYKLRAEQLPRIQRTDPVARYYGLVRGQVVKIVRPSETAGKYVTYRLVV